jgi:hypothetical protein
VIDTDGICCLSVSGRRDLPSPFQRLIALGYYDGPTSGLAECARCRKSYRLELVAWDTSQDVRVFATATFEMERFERVIRACARQEEPNWPVWVPNLSLLPLEARAELDGLLSEEPEFEWLLASRHLEDSILAADIVPPSSRAKLLVQVASRRFDEGAEWFRLLQIPMA